MAANNEAAAASDDRVFALGMERGRADLFGMLDQVYGHPTDDEGFCKALVAAVADHTTNSPRSDVEAPGSPRLFLGLSRHGDPD